MTVLSSKETIYLKVFELGINDTKLMVEASRIGGEKMLKKFLRKANFKARTIAGVNIFKLKDTIIQLPKILKILIGIRIMLGNEQPKIDKMLKEIENFLRLPTQTIQLFIISSMIAQFEAYLEDITFEIAKIKLAKDKASHPQVTQLQSKEITRKMVEGWFDNKFDDIIKNLISQTKLPINEFIQKSGLSLTEIDKAIAIRNIYLHNNGRVSDKFKARIMNDNLVVGEYYLLDINYLVKIRDILCWFVIGFDAITIEKYPEIIELNVIQS